MNYSTQPQKTVFTYLEKETASRTGTIVIVGVGYVGLPLAIRAAFRQFPVIGFDIDAGKIERLSRREASYITHEEQNLLRELPNISFTANESDIWHAQTYIMCVPTPVFGNHAPDLKPLESAARIVGRHLSPGALVIIESTVNPGACERVALPILEDESGLVVERDFFFAHCPERINPGDSEWNIATIPRVLGAAGPKSLERALALYRDIIDADIRTMPSIREAEAVKMVENSFRDINIAFVNELAMSFDRAGIDLVSVIEGASTKPFSFMAHFPGCGVGGHCIPVDPYYLIRYGEENGFDHQFLATARRINNKMPKYTVRRLVQALKEKNRRIRGSTVALLGLSYKRDIPDVRESPALEIEEELHKKKAHVRTFDPFVPSASNVTTLEEALEGADAVIIATDHTSFRSLTPSDFERHGVNIVIDGRNCLPKKAFLKSTLIYRGIGR
ncbi:UDP-N-acetyl-D-glucosamine dehydrogenase [Candidatus Kaiserbacteria bacterium CG10_big_fil_rev_8_21_14_0_10_51_14]|uniref:UDP-N-acetyl-D-glucosamine dehydrogenase n=1 Tax=Candidatus Kaiserbacteria bacterium CG10_big_fil_rev_8_21_14_0_10_51_14 TaxID=1974610 RepID=A0A2H0UCF0_9BACT|nr:MAG: UDP-N-acetyl-D-glucosamine dehydrogenase [Candidatus Kaiserbacteria bacterium CG10_big_fil_rev_8_21_14_0_10_51_14]